jgi:hypothetical protein
MLPVCSCRLCPALELFFKSLCAIVADMNEREEMNTRNSIVGVAVVFALLSIACEIIYDIQQKKGFISFCGSVAQTLGLLGLLGLLAMLWTGREKPNNPN